MKAHLRPGRAGDAEVCGRICFEAFAAIARQHNFPLDFPTPEIAIGLVQALLGRSDVYSVVAEIDGSVVGSNFLWESASVSGVGPITVEPKGQNGAVGRALMQDVMERSRSRRHAAIRLVQAAYHNRSLSLYTKLGFNAYEPLSTMQGPALNLGIPGYPVRAATDADLEACNRLCLRIHGHERSQDVLDGIRQGTASLVEFHGRITGYATLIGLWGHAVAENNEGLKALIGAAPVFHGPGFLLPTRNAELFRWCLNQGLRVVHPMTLMSMGLYNEPAGAFLPSVIY